MRKSARAAAYLAVLALWLGGCGFKSSKPAEPAANNLEAGKTALAEKNYLRVCEVLSAPGTPTEGEAGAEAQYLLGLGCFKAAQAKSEQAFKRSLAAKGDHVPSMEALGLLYFSMGDMAGARTWLDRSAGAGGKSVEAAIIRGEVAYLDGRCEDALAAYGRAVELDSGNMLARSRLTMVRSNCGKKAAPSAGTPGAATGPAGTATPSPAQDKAKSGPRTIDLNDI